jgi:hypothetical protein
VRITSKKTTVLPIWPILIYAAACVLLTLLWSIDLGRHLFEGWTIADLFDRRVTESGAGFDRTFLVDSWSGVPMLCFALLFGYGHYRASAVLFLPFFIMSFTPAWIYFFTDNAYVLPMNYIASMLSLIAYVYLLLNLMLTWRMNARNKTKATKECSKNDSVGIDEHANGE